MNLPPLFFKVFWKILQNNYSDENLWKDVFRFVFLNSQFQCMVTTWHWNAIFQELFAVAMKLFCLIFVLHPFLEILIFKLLFGNLGLVLILKLTFDNLYIGLQSLHRFRLWLLKCCKSRDFYYVLYSYYMKFYFLLYMSYLCYMFYYIFITYLYVYVFKFVLHFYFHIIWF